MSFWMNSAATGSTLSYLMNTTSGTTTATSIDWTAVINVARQMMERLQRGVTYGLPDGSQLKIDADGNFEVLDEDAKVVHKACHIRAFNRFLNASELLERFIADLAPLGVRQSQVLKVPVEAFISWLVLRAAEADGDELPTRRHAHRCIQCMRFLPVRLVAQGVNFCSSAHLDRYLARAALPAPA